ncbi:MAG: fatty acid desaturase, partial [Gammaproteobacteria bacterium]|nr:fatty acid desaturase [Gammaproteobacteria bacterium]
MTTKIRELLTAEELARVTSKDDLRAACIVLLDWAMVIGLFVLAAAFPNPVTILFAVLLLGGRQ